MLRALRRVRREYGESPECGGPLTRSTINKLVERAGELTGLAFAVQPLTIQDYLGLGALERFAKGLGLLSGAGSPRSVARCPISTATHRKSRLDSGDFSEYLSCAGTAVLPLRHKRRCRKPMMESIIRPSRLPADAARIEPLAGWQHREPRHG